MKQLRLVLGFAAVLLLVGCGAATSAGSASTAPVPALNGAWNFTLVSQVTSKTYQASGTLSTGGTTVLGSLQLTGSSCFANAGVPYSFVLGFTSAISPAGALSITAPATNPNGTLEGQTLAISGLWSNGAVTSGTFTVTGGCDNADHGTVTGAPA